MYAGRPKPSSNDERMTPWIDPSRTLADFPHVGYLGIICSGSIHLVFFSSELSRGI
jgi:hypothetical protein